MFIDDLINIFNFDTQSNKTLLNYFKVNFIFLFTNV